MKPLPAPPVPGHTEWERFDNAVSMVLAVPKKAFLKEEATRKAKRRRKKAKKRSSGESLGKKTSV
jgi:hypothetical protein